MNGTIRNIIVGCLLLCWPWAGEPAAQEEARGLPAYPGRPVEKRDFDREAWQKLTEGIDYSTDQMQERSPRSAPADGPRISPEVGNTVMKVLIAVFGIVFLIVLMRSLLQWKKAPADKSFDPNRLRFDLQQIEENLLETALDPYIEQAREKGDYALVIRLYFLALLQALAQTGYIKWKKDKTNRAYARELAPHGEATAFRELALIYERIWYGGKIVSAEELARTEPAFQQYLQKIKNQAPASATTESAA